MNDHEIVPGVVIAALGPSERLLLGGLRLIASGRGRCPMLVRGFESLLGSQGSGAAQGAAILAERLCAESGRKLTLGWMSIRGVTWDEAAILALLEAAQRTDAPAIARWMSRLGIASPSPALQRGLAWTAAAFSVAGKPFDPDVATLTQVKRSRIAQIRDQIETQFGEGWPSPHAT